MEETFKLTTERTNLVTKPQQFHQASNDVKNVKYLMAESNRNLDDSRVDNAATKITPIQTIRLKVLIS